MSLPRLILGSGSPQRQRLLTEAGYEFTVINPGEAAECGICSTGGPASLVAELALRKAADVAGKLAVREVGGPPMGSLIIACDTVAECGGAVLGKPSDEEHARAMLRLLSGQVHRVYSGLCLWPHQIAQPARPIETRIAVTELRMDRLSEANLEDYLASGLWRSKAGAFGYQDRAGWLHILAGSEANVIGLPIELLEEMLAPWT
jgi:nucleoside triphosphate pyrophosphatase